MNQLQYELPETPSPQTVDDENPEDFSENFDKPEDWAIVMAQNGRIKDAHEAFEKIITSLFFGKKTRNILLKNENGTFDPTVNKKRKLGIEGLYYFAQVTESIGKYADARNYYEEIVHEVSHSSGKQDECVLDICKRSQDALDRLATIKLRGVSFSKN